jgi:hypothetical protein
VALALARRPHELDAMLRPRLERVPFEVERPDQPDQRPLIRTLDRRLIPLNLHSVALAVLAGWRAEQPPDLPLDEVGSPSPARRARTPTGTVAAKKTPAD